MNHLIKQMRLKIINLPRSGLLEQHTIPDWGYAAAPPQPVSMNVIPTMTMEIKIIGNYKVESDEPCHLLELEIRNPTDGFDLGSITQEISDEDIDNWQVPYDEHYLNIEGEKPIDPDYPDEMPNSDMLRVAFYFHYLDINKPLRTPAGDVKIIKETKRPDRLNFMVYEPPY